MSYYDRTSQTYLDGTEIFQNETDRQNEESVAKSLGEAWGCRIRPFGALSPIDWHAERNGRFVGILELKARPHAHDRYPTVFLNVRKWMTLTRAELGLGVPALFVVKFDDGIFWIPVAQIDARQCRMGGCVKLVKSGNDIEPIIDVPISSMRRI